MKPPILAGLIGAGIQASRTPVLHEQEGDAQGLRYLYRLIDLEPLHLDINALPDLLHAAFLRADLWVAEIVYFPLETELLRDARALGCRTLDGGNMAVFQAVKAFELFSGEMPDAGALPKHEYLTVETESKCGSGLAREYGGSAN